MGVHRRASGVLSESIEIPQRAFDNLDRTLEIADTFEGVHED